MQSISSLMKTAQTTKMCQTKLYSPGSIHTHANCIDKEMLFLRICPHLGQRYLASQGWIASGLQSNLSKRLRQVSMNNSQAVELSLLLESSFSLPALFPLLSRTPLSGVHHTKVEFL